MKSLFRSEQPPVKARRQSRNLRAEALEAREVPAATSFVLGGVLSIYGTDAKEIVSVNTVGSYGVSVYDGSNQSTRFFLKSDITARFVVFYGLGGDDFFSNNVSGLQAAAYGGAGSDTLVGGDGADRLYGEAGDDLLYGYGGIDYLDGGTEADVLHGGDGEDYLHGGAGNDALYGEGGRDWLYGEAGNDYLNGGKAGDGIYGDGITDYVYGGTGADSFHYSFDDGRQDFSNFDGDRLVTY